jgi:hypothetical protein
VDEVAITDGMSQPRESPMSKCAKKGDIEVCRGSQESEQYTSNRQTLKDFPHKANISPVKILASPGCSSTAALARGRITSCSRCYSAITLGFRDRLKWG